MNGELITTLREQIATMGALIQSRRLKTFLDVNRNFPFTIYVCADIPLLHEMIENLSLRTGLVLTYAIPEYMVSLRGTNHREMIASALERGRGLALRDG